MSCDFAVWYPQHRLSNQEAGKLYVRLCEGNQEGVQSHHNLESFYEELTSKHPEIDSIPDDKVDDLDHCPWSCAHDRSPGHIIMCCVWPKAAYVEGLVRELAKKHGLAVYDPQSEKIHYPDDAVIVKGGSRRRARTFALLALTGIGGLAYAFGQDMVGVGSTPLQFLGGFLIGVAILGGVGLNIWRGGPLDKRNDPK